MSLVDEVVQHLLSHFEIRDDAIFHGADGDDIPRRAPYHFFGFFADCFYFPVILVDSDNGRLINNDAFLSRVNESIGRSQIDGKIGRKKAKDGPEVHEDASMREPTILTRREWFALSGLLLSSGCGRKKGTGYAGYALIATSGDNSVAVVDLTAFRLLRPIELGASPTAVVPGGPAGQSYVLTPATGSVHVVSADLRRVSTHRLGDQISSIRVTADGKRLLATDAKTRQLIEADASSVQVIRRHSLNGKPIDMDLAGGRYAAVSTSERDSVELFNFETGQQWRAEMPGKVGAVRFRSDGQLLLVANLHDRSLTALSVPRLELIAELPLAMQPENLCFDSSQGQLFVSGEGMDGVAIVFPYRILEVEQTVLAGRDPGVMASSATPAYLFVASNSGSDVCVMEINHRKVVGIVDAGRQPTYITVTPDNQYALVLDESSGDMAVIHISVIRLDFKSVSGKSGAALFTMLSVGDKPVHVAVVPRNG